MRENKISRLTSPPCHTPADIAHLLSRYKAARPAQYAYWLKLEGGAVPPTEAEIPLPHFDVSTDVILFLSEITEWQDHGALVRAYIEIRGQVYKDVIASLADDVRARLPLIYSRWIEAEASGDPSDPDLANTKAAVLPLIASYAWEGEGSDRHAEYAWRAMRVEIRNRHGIPHPS